MTNLATRADAAPIEPTGRAPTRRVSQMRLFALGTIAALMVLAAPRSSSGLEHTVAPGETLGAIAPRYGTTVEAMVRTNSISDPHRIFSGQVLTIPAEAASAVVAAGASTHSVQPGETLSSIATRYGLTTAELADANGITDPDFVRDGTTLTVVTTPDATSGSAEHVVLPGESLAAIAARYGVDVAALVQANGLSDPDIVLSGSVLRITQPSSRPAATGDSGTVIGTAAAPLIGEWARAYGVPVDLLKALTWFESGWNNDLVSDAGAVGVGQLMPDTTDFVSQHLLGEPIDPYDLSDNIRASSRLLRHLLDETGWDAGSALAAYYQGLGAFRQHGVYASSQFYIDGILALRSRF